MRETVFHQLVFRGPKCAKEISIRSSPLMTIKGNFWLDRLNVANSSDLATCFPVSNCPIVMWPVVSSDAVVQLLHDPARRAFRDALLHAVVAVSGYLIRCCLPTTSNTFCPSGCSSLASGITKAFLLSDCRSVRISSLSGPFSANPGDSCGEIPEDQQLLK